jgi:hypothetical protein
MPTPTIPVAIVAERVAVKSGLAEMVQPLKIPRRELIVSDLVVVERMVVHELILNRMATWLIVCEHVATGGAMRGEPPGVAGYGVTVAQIMTGVMISATDAMAGHRVASDRVCVGCKAVSSAWTAKPQPVSHAWPMTQVRTQVRDATVDGKPMRPPAPSPDRHSGMPAATTVRSATTVGSATARGLGDRWKVRREAKRTHRDARCQNSYCFVFHDIPQSKFSRHIGVPRGSDAWRAEVTYNSTVLPAASFQIGN